MKKKKKNSAFYIAKSVGFYINFLSFFAPNKAFNLAYHFFTQPRKGRLDKDNLPEFLSQAKISSHQLFDQSSFVTYTWKGTSADTILLVHGWESNSARWQKTMPYLKQTNATIIAIDAPAHGLTPGKEFNMITYTEMIKQIVLSAKVNIIVGHSMGGITAIFHQYKYPNAGIEKMVILGAPSSLRGLLKHYFDKLGLNNRMLRAFENHYKQNYNIEIDDFSAQIFCENLQIPGWIAHDILDDIVPFAEGEKIANRWKSSQLVQTKNLGHSMHHVDLYKKMKAFLQQ